MHDLIAGIQNSGFATIDLVIVLVYLCLLIFLGLFLGRTKKEGRAEKCQ